MVVWEAANKRIEFEEEDSFLIVRILIHRYVLSRSELKMDATETFWLVKDQWVSRLYTLVKMYALGDRYDLKGFKQEAEERFKARLDDWPIEEFIALIPLIYSSTPDTDRGLRDRAVKYGTNEWETLWGASAFRKGLT
ncbi:MAG: hypothetical protein Q9161_006993 [Pseudevernia consocians]